MKPRKCFLKFLTSSLENKLVLSSTQISLLEPNLTEEQVRGYIDEAKWHILEQRTENGVQVYVIVDRGFVCTCGKDPVHWHYDEACCGREYCCPENSFDVDVEIAMKVACIREMLEQRKKVRL